MAELTRCQLRALSLAADGLRVGEIAELMNISVRTAEHHLKTARKAMDSKTTAGAVASAIRQGLITSIVAIIIACKPLDLMATTCEAGAITGVLLVEWSLGSEKRNDNCDRDWDCKR